MSLSRTDRNKANSSGVLFRPLGCVNFDAFKVKAQKISRVESQQGVHARVPSASCDCPIIGSAPCYVVVNGLSEQCLNGFVVQACECSFCEETGLDEGDRIPWRQSMGWWESGEYGICFNQGWCGDNKGFSFCESTFHLGNGSLVVFMPRAYCGNHDISVWKKTVHAGLGRSCSVANELLACPFDSLTREWLDRLIRNGNQESATFFQLDKKRYRLNFD